MAEEAKIAPVVTEGAETKASAPAADAPKEETVGEALKPETVEKPAEMVPLSALLAVKKDNKQLAKDMAALQKSIEEGATAKDTTDDLDTLATEHNVPVKFLKDFARAVRAEVKKESKQEVETEIAEKLKPVLEKERAKSFEERFNTHFDKALDTMPEYKDVVNKSVIKTLCLAPENANKTLTQIIEDSFGRFVTGKRTIDAGSSRGSKSDDLEIDTKRMKTDTGYFKEVMANPALKKKYNEGMTQRLSSRL